MINRITTAGDRAEDPIYVKQLANTHVPKLTGNQRMVYEALLNLGRSAGAYEILELLKKKGVNAAATVYRALNDLRHKGLVQKIVSTRTFIAHQQPKDKSEESVLLICQHCGEVSSINDDKIAEVFDRNIAQSGYKVSTYHLELMVSCDSCDEALR
jgi:Fur family transcriptional regulator, zinc uptake regulator